MVDAGDTHAAIQLAEMYLYLEPKLGYDMHESAKWLHKAVELDHEDAFTIVYMLDWMTDATQPVETGFVRLEVVFASASLQFYLVLFLEQH